MKNGTKIYKKIKTLKTSLSKNKINNRNNITINSKQYNYYEEEYPESFIKSKSLNKIKIKKGSNKKGIKLPSIKKNIFNEKNNSKIMKNYLIKNNSYKKFKINTNNINNYYPNNQSSNKLLSKHSGSSYNLKMSQNYNKTKKNILTTSSTSNLGLGRHLDRKVITGNKSLVMPKKGYKLFTTTKIINNFNNQINQNKNKEIYTLYNDDTQNNSHIPNNLLSYENEQSIWNDHISDKNNLKEPKKLDVLYEIENKVSKIQNCFRKHLKEEETVETTNHQNDLVNNNFKNDNAKKLDVLYELEKKVSKIQNCFRKHLKEEETVETTNYQSDMVNSNFKNDNILDIISDISLSEEELNFSEEDSLEQKEFSLDDEDL